MTITLTKPVREVALELPQSTRIFEKMNIDYCCGGDRLLQEACVTAGVNVEELMQMLEDVQAGSGNEDRDFRKATLTELITYIVEKHHVYTLSGTGSLRAGSPSAHSFGEQPSFSPRN
ncbi:MAG TPA: DUF542 domain-containing protein [Pyrinomonadaceae bacterium]|nr:DUF542 domain-containing protein [Pyrinomonadaceae bacterium]